MMPFLHEQMQWIYFLQEARSPAIDGIFKILNFFDTDYFICSLIAFIWIGCSWRWGIRLGFLMIVSGWVNTIAKMAFSWPRPFFLDASLAIVKVHDYGFPSGGAQFSMMLALLVIYFWKSRWAWPVGIFYVVTISFSRIFLGVHFPLDVLGGWVLGLALFAAFIYSVQPIERWMIRHATGAMVGSVCSAVVIVLLSQDYKTAFLLSSFGSMVLGVYISTRWKLYMTPPSGRMKQIGLGLFGIGSAMLASAFSGLIVANPCLASLIQAITSTLWISLFASPFCKRAFAIR